jgi:DNA-binding beta-propeller fold protein YncE
VSRSNTAPPGVRLRRTGWGRLRSAAAALAVLVLTAVAGLAPGVEARQAGPAATNVLYVESNDFRPGLNAVFAFRRDPATGCLTPLPGSPFLTRGTGVDNPTDSVGPFDSDQDLIASPDGRFLFVTNSGSNTIAVFEIAADGSLSHVRGSPFPSGGIEPVSVGLAGNTLYVVNKNEDPAQLPNGSLPNYTAFKVNPQGTLIPIPHSTVEVPARSSPTQALVSRDGRFLFGADIAVNINPTTGSVFLGQPVLRSFRIRSNGRLDPAPGSPYMLPVPPLPPFALPPLPPLPPVPLGLDTHPTLPILYAGAVSSDRLTVFRIDPNSGQLTFQDAAPNSGRGICWVRSNAAGTRVYTVNTLTTSVSVYDTTDPLHPVEIQHLPLNGPGDLFNLTVDPDDRFVYVISQRSNGFPSPNAVNAIHVLQIGPDGTLTEAPCSPHLLPAGVTYRPQGVVAL